MVHNDDNQVTRTRPRARTVIAAVCAIGALCAFAWVAVDVAEYDSEDAARKTVTEAVALPSATPETTETAADEASNDTNTSTDDDPLYRRLDFDALEAENPSATRWLYVPGTAIDSYVIQERTVGYFRYQHRDIDGDYTRSGSFVVPADPDGTEDDARLLILGHHMLGAWRESMFSALPRRWGHESGAVDYPYVYVYTSSCAYRYRVWSAAYVRRSDVLYDTPYERNSDEYAAMLEHMADVSQYTHGTAPTAASSTLQLSTCSSADGLGTAGRFVLTCVLDETYDYASGTTTVSDTVASTGTTT